MRELEEELSKELEQMSELTLSEQLNELELSQSEDQLSELKSQLDELDENSVQLDEELDKSQELDEELDGQGGWGRASPSQTGKCCSAQDAAAVIVPAFNWRQAPP